MGDFYLFCESDEGTLVQESTEPQNISRLIYLLQMAITENNEAEVLKFMYQVQDKLSSPELKEELSDLVSNYKDDMDVTIARLEVFSLNLKVPTLETLIQKICNP